MIVMQAELVYIGEMNYLVTNVRRSPPQRYNIDYDSESELSTEEISSVTRYVSNDKLWI